MRVKRGDFLRSIQGQVGWYPDQAGLVEVMPAHGTCWNQAILSNLNHSMISQWFLHCLNTSTTLWTPTQQHSHEGTCPPGTCALWSGGTFLPGGVAIMDNHIQFGDTHRHFFQSRQDLRFDKAHFLLYSKTGPFLISLNPTPSPISVHELVICETTSKFIFHGWMFITHIEKPQNRLEHILQGKKAKCFKNSIKTYKKC